MSNKKQVLISTISYNKTHNTHYVVIKDALNEYAISRTEKQLQGDLDSINLKIKLAHHVKNCKAEVALTYHKMGDTIFDREGNAVTDEAGKEQVYRKDGARIDGFMIIELNQTMMIAQLIVAETIVAPTEAPSAVVEETAFAPEADV